MQENRTTNPVDDAAPSTGPHAGALPPRARAGSGRRRSLPGTAILVGLILACTLSLPWMFTPAPGEPAPRYNSGSPSAGRLPPWWWPARPDALARIAALADDETVAAISTARGISAAQVRDSRDPAVLKALAENSTYAREKWRSLLGTDALGRSLFFRCLAGGGISIAVGLAAAAISVTIGTLYGALAGYVGGTIDAVMMRFVDVLYGLPYVLLVVLLAVAADSLAERFTRSRIESAAAARENYIAHEFTKFDPADRTDELRQRLADEALEKYGAGELGTAARTAIDLVTLLVAIGGVSWLTMARVVRGQVLSLRNQPFVEAARSVGAGPGRIFFRHLLPNLVGPITVYATLTVPQAILQESFLSFLGIGVKPPLPSWGGLASDGLSELNPYQSDWWLLLFPCLLLAVTLVALNLAGESLRASFDPKGRGR